jgi:hypothetical protein
LWNRVPMFDGLAASEMHSRVSLLNGGRISRPPGRLGGRAN